MQKNTGSRIFRGPTVAEAAVLGPCVNRVDEFDRLHEAWGNPYAANGDLLAACVMLARQADGPVIEYGSGLSSLAMAAATSHPVHAIEHDEEWVKTVREAADKLGLTNLTVMHAPLVEGWYAAEGLLPKYVLALVDGPPRRFGRRDKAVVAEADVYLFDDVSDQSVKAAVARISAERELKVHPLNSGHMRAFCVLYKDAVEAAA